MIGEIVGNVLFLDYEDECQPANYVCYN